MVAALLGAGLLVATGPAALTADHARARPGGPIRVWMRDVVLYPYDDAPSRITELSGTVAPTRLGRGVVFDDVGSYAVHVEHAEVRLTAATLSVLMNRYVLPSANGPIKHVDVSFGPGVLQIKGTMVKAGAPIPFTADATAAPDADGDMQIHIVRMRAAGIVPKGLMDALGLKMSRVAQPRNTGVFHIVGDTMVVPVASMFPPPKFSGRLTAVNITPQEMVAVIGSGAAAPPRAGTAGRYIHFRGGTVRFARLTMRDTDLTMTPKTDAGPFGFSPAHYYAQMQAGYTLATPERGLVCHIADYSTLLRPAAHK